MTTALLDAAYTVTGDFTEDGLVDDLLSEMLFVEDELAACASDGDSGQS